MSTSTKEREYDENSEEYLEIRKVVRNLERMFVKKVRK